MTVDNINVEESIEKVIDLLAEEKDFSPALKTSRERDLLSWNLQHVKRVLNRYAPL